MQGSEHIFRPVPGSTTMKCSCGLVFATAAEQQQHLSWHLALTSAFQSGLDKGAAVTWAAQRSGQDQVDVLVGAAYRRGLDSAIAALPEVKEEWIKQAGGGRDLYDVPAHSYNQALAEAKSNIEKLKEPSNESNGELK